MSGIGAERVAFLKSSWLPGTKPASESQQQEYEECGPNKRPRSTFARFATFLA
jgi:hypothetical protein